MLNNYIKGITSTAADIDATEHSYRTAIDKMLQAATDEFGTDLDVLHEPRRGKFGAPDFRVSAKGSGGIIGYVECKKPGANLQKLTTSAQLKNIVHCPKTSYSPIHGAGFYYVTADESATSL